MSKISMGELLNLAERINEQTSKLATLDPALRHGPRYCRNADLDAAMLTGTICSVLSWHYREISIVRDIKSHLAPPVTESLQVPEATRP